MPHHRGEVVAAAAPDGVRPTGYILVLTLIKTHPSGVGDVKPQRQRAEYPRKGGQPSPVDRDKSADREPAGEALGINFNL